MSCSHGCMACCAHFNCSHCACAGSFHCASLLLLSNVVHRLHSPCVCVCLLHRKVLFTIHFLMGLRRKPTSWVKVANSLQDGVLWSVFLHDECVESIQRCAEHIVCVCMPLCWSGFGLHTVYVRLWACVWHRGCAHSNSKHGARATWKLLLRRCSFNHQTHCSSGPCFVGHGCVLLIRIFQVLHCCTHRDSAQTQHGMRTHCVQL